MKNFFSLSFITITLLVFTLTCAEAGETALPDNPTLLKADNADDTHLMKNTNSRTGNVNFLSVKKGYAIGRPALAGVKANQTKEQSARSFLSIYGQQFGLKNAATIHLDNDAEEIKLVPTSTKIAKDARSVVRFKQTYKNIPVYGSDLIVGMDKNDSLLSINGEVAAEINLFTVPSILADNAKNIALEITAKTYKTLATSLKASNPELIIFNAALVGMPGDSSNLLAWKCEVSGKATEEPINQLVFINAQNGKVIYHFNQTPDAKNRSTYDSQNTETSAILRRSEGQANIGEKNIDNAHNFAGDTYDFYMREHNRDSIDGQGMLLKSFVHNGVNICNAFWFNKVMTYGDGCFIVTDDVVAHELTHGVTEYESGLIYNGQSGAINEAFSDIWGEFVDLTNGKGTDTAAVRWLMGEEVSVGAFRNMSNPPAKNQPDKIQSPLYNCGASTPQNDYGGVHTNSGVANKAAYLITDGGSFNGYFIAGLGIFKTADLFYEVQTNILTQNATYASLYSALNQACTNLHYTTAECQQVKNAGLATQMNLTPCNPTGKCSSQSIAVNSSVNGALATTDCLSTIRTNSYADNLTFQAKAGLQYTIRLNSAAFDTYLYLLSGSNVLAQNDDANTTSSNSVIVYTPAGSGLLTIHPSSYNPSEVGAYTVSVSTTSVTKPIAPSLMSASTTSNSINVSWNDNANNESGFNLYRFDNGFWVKIQTLAANVTSFTNTGLVSGRTYYYAIEAYNSAGTAWTTYSNGWIAATTKTSTLTKPVAPSTMAVYTTSNSVSVYWSDNSNNETGFNLYRWNGVNWVKIKTLAANVTSYIDTGLAAATDYFYYVSAYNSVGESNTTYPNGWILARTTAVISKPIAPSTMAVATTSNSATIYWNDLSNNETGFKLYRWNGFSWVQIASLAANVTAYTNTGLISSSDYYYSVSAYNSAGESNTTYPNGWILARTKAAVNQPIAPSAMAVSSTRNSITVYWNDLSNNETGFKLYRWNGFNWVQIAALAANVTAYTNSGLLPASAYYYYVSAYNSAGESNTTYPNGWIVGLTQP